MSEPTSFDVIDLGRDEQAVYEAVVTHQPIKRAALAELQTVNESAIDAAIDSLLASGLICASADQADAFLAAPPDIALGALLLDREEQLRRARLEVEKLAKLHQRVASTLDQPRNLLEVISGRDAVLQRIAQVQRSCQTDIRVIDKPPYVQTDPRGNVALELEQSNRGVRYRAIYDPSGLDSFHDLTGDVQASVEAGVEARVLPETPFKLMIADDRLAVIPLRTTTQDIDSVIVVHPSPMLDALAVLFEQLWERSMPLILPGMQSGPRTSPHQPSDDDRRLLCLLTAGLPDEAIAKHLRVSHRTMQRRLRVLLDRLGAQTRFQAALRAVTLGWIPTPPAEQPIRVAALRQAESASAGRFYSAEHQRPSSRAG